ERGRYPIPQLGVELGIWQGEYDEMNLPWLRWWDSEGNLLLIGEERAREAHLRAEEEKQRADRLAAKLREMGINPDEV
ncbi:MAG: Uma2 family endonuclease, partial [Microcoleus sp. C1-bin4]|nr:Uma2 family endonuclease [Microcoleus sp. C1-bin4]